ncbi:MAG: CDP-glucose 4,6-dehydratase [Candidatus Lambdaproteobacteria bacterium RIFOXYD1_FULL_56_27]|uniref:CDP-glucose 4,6-dehydratase n=1 Tax=Candidatus Lambdaproteobacteria bacterium RIFOXYD2_FULL_56_26 TaxID=1817773 RepID=A0A1F6GUG9_9PROT|nr:MAG: CDP-glucose 4,6-dehydratase [Candidatus Lambdaproteobacteria bacterium RIFOXYC1_FULL_56_13]OGH01822.1 MAG: CDP-glucose 4,6-dehydratase [Candidatus Lambdaproteobacteria bacterium RIFOXYD2_FULL_56_26]OGH07534.1 MAG: CDP-glucose 4,6-dehydratase [Candidatus Lambdaproteobacteria bacterium RIFOXYD1_FULL_56_27]
MKLLDAFENKRVLVTGHTGFKGSWLTLWLTKMGAQVTGLALPPASDQDLFPLLGLESKIDHQVCDLRDAAAVNRIFEQAQPEYLFHLAAQPLVRYSYQEPKETFDTNVGGSVNVLEAARRSQSLRSVVYVTSDKCYKNKEWEFGYRENDELGGHDPYSASKAAAEILFASYEKSFFAALPKLGIASARAGNVIGGGDWAADRIFPDCIRALRSGQPIGVRNPKSTRPWQHVLDPLSGYLRLAAALYRSPKEFGGSWNFGPSITAVQPVRNLVENIVGLWGQGRWEDQSDPKALHEATLLHLNCDKALQFLGWGPTWGFDRAVKESLLWYKAQKEGRQMVEFTSGQIDQFINDARI